MKTPPRRINENRAKTRPSVIKQRMNEVSYRPNIETDDDRDYFDGEGPDPVIYFKDFDDMLDQLRYYFYYKRDEDKEKAKNKGLKPNRNYSADEVPAFVQLKLVDIKWDKTVLFVDAEDTKQGTVVYMNPYFAEILLDRMEDELNAHNPNIKMNTNAPDKYVYFKLFHAACIYAGVLCVIDDNITRALGSNSEKNLMRQSGLYNETFDIALSSYQNHAWGLKILREIMQEYWPQI